MTASFTLRFRKQYQKLSEDRQVKFDKPLAILLSNLRHPSLRAKKFDEENDLWQARVDDDYRFHFMIEGDRYILLSIIPSQIAGSHSWGVTSASRRSYGPWHPLDPCGSQSIAMSLDCQRESLGSRVGSSP